MKTTRSQTWQWLAIIVALLLLGAGYWYFSARAGVKQGAPLGGPAPSNLVGYWSFDGDDISGATAYDRSGSGNNGTTSGSPVKIAGKLGQALSFSGGSQVSIASPSSAVDINVGGKVSTAFWYYSRHGNGSNGTIYHRASGGCAQYQAVLLGGATTDAISFYYRGTDDCSGVDNYQVTGITKDAWHHVVSTYDTTNGMFVVYVDGIAKLTATTIPTSAIAFGAGAPLAIGINAGSGAPYFEGTIDDVRIYNTALTASQVYDLYKLGGETVGASTPTRDSLNEGLAGYWKLDDASGTTATDSSVNGNNGTLTNGPTWTTGQIGGATTFDGSNDYINNTDNFALNSPDITISFWINYSAHVGWGALISKNPNEINSGLWDWGITFNQWVDEIILIRNGANVGATGVAIPKNQWVHVTAVMSDTQSKTYHNGVLVSTQGGIGSGNTINTAGRYVQIMNNGAATGGVTGSIDEVRVYNRPLSGEEISRLYKTTIPSNPDTRLKGYWSFDGDAISGTTARDLSGGGNNGTLTNGPTVTEGIRGQALNFDGTDDHVSVPDSNSLDITGQLTLSAWIKPTSITPIGDKSILRKESSGENYGLVLGGNGDVPSGNLEFVYFSGIWRIIDSGYKVPNTDWHHIVVTFKYSNTSILFYDNGVLVATKTAAADLTSNTSAVNIGMDMSNKYFSGAIDEVRIYNAALTASEIWNLYQEGGVKVNKSQSNNGDSLNDGLAGYWKLDDASGTTATDSSGNGNNGTLTNGPTWGTGQVGGAVTFDGVDDYITVTSNPIFNTSVITVSAWVNTNDGSSLRTAISRDDTITNRDWILGTGATGNTFRFAIFIGNTQINAESGTQFSTGAWHHLVGTYDGSNVKLYVDGINTVTTAQSGSLDTDSANVVIGSRVVTSTYWNGKVDETRIYNRALSAEEVTRLYKTTSPTNPETGLVGYWSFNGKDLSGTTAYDRSGKGNNGTLTNGPTITEGKVGQGLNFDGSNDFIDVSNESSFDFERTQAFSFGLWLKAVGQADIKLPIGKGVEGGSYAGWELFTNFDGSGIAAGKLSFNLISTIFTNHLEVVTTTASNLNNGSWHYYVVTYDGSSTPGGIKIYEDGISLALSTVYNNLSASILNNEKLNFGTRGNSITNTYLYSGLMDEVRIYNRALSSSEIQSLYNFGR